MKASSSPKASANATRGISDVAAAPTSAAGRAAATSAPESGRSTRLCIQA